MGKADLHIHSTYSYDGTATVPAILEHVKRNTDLDVIAITDHDEIDGALEAVALAPKYGLAVIPGVEVSTAEGHLLALFVTQPVPANLSLVETVQCVAEQGGICVGAHPGGPWRWCLQEKNLACALQARAVADTLLGLEVYNASLPHLGINRKANAIGQRLALAQVGNSDAHLLWMIGLAATEFPGKTAADLKSALHDRLTTTAVSKRPLHYLASHLKHQFLRQVGLAHCSPAVPGSPIVLRRLAAIERLHSIDQPLIPL